MLRYPVLYLTVLALLAAYSRVSAESLKVVQTAPAEHAVIEGPGEGFFVRFDHPVDHNRSRLIVKRGEEVVETLQPRFKTEPNVLFARPSSLAPGDYTLHWLVMTLEGSEVTEGDIAFSVAPKR